jgi:hypothetical protein
MNPDLSKIHTDEPPKDGRQFLAWAIDLHGEGFRKPAKRARWCVVFWGDPLFRDGDLEEDKEFMWTFPGCTTCVEVLGWIELPWNDR